MKIVIETIPHEKQRYPTVGDYWQEPDGTLQIRVSDTQNDRYAVLVAVHELIESFLCIERSIDIAQIDAFDIEYENNREVGDTSEPGDSIAAPYYHEHQFATIVERQLALEMGINWQEYDFCLNQL